MNRLPSHSMDSYLGVPEFPEKSCQNKWNPHESENFGIVEPFGVCVAPASTDSGCLQHLFGYQLGAIPE